LTPFLDKKCPISAPGCIVLGNSRGRSKEEKKAYYRLGC